MTESAGGRRRSAAQAAAPPADLLVAAPPPGSIGAELRAAREALGISLPDVAERTKVRPGILHDIEADAHDRLPALTYSLGFVKAYARTVGLDPAAAAERYRRESLKGDPVPTMVDLQPLEERRLPSRRLVAMTTGALVLLLGGFWAWGAGWLTPAPPAEPSVASAPAEESVDDSDAPAPPPAAPAADARVTLTATDDVWLRINDGAEDFFQGTLAKGQTLALPPGRAWLLRTGRAGAIAIKVGDAPVAPLGGPVEQIRNVSLQPADLLGRPAPAAGGLAPTARLPAPPTGLPATTPVSRAATTG